MNAKNLAHIYTQLIPPPRLSLLFFSHLHMLAIGAVQPNCIGNKEVTTNESNEPKKKKEPTENGEKYDRMSSNTVIVSF